MSTKPRAPKAQNDKPDETANVEEELPERRFQLVPGDDEENPVIRVMVGADPRISIGADETYSTNDPRLAERLAAHPELEEVTR